MLLIVGIGLAIVLIALNANAVLQGIFVTGSAVYANQLIKQVNKKQ